jgi:hypothetical protein
MFKGCNEVLNLGRTEGLELVDHLVEFLPLKNFHMPFPILIEQMMCQEKFNYIKSDCKDFPFMHAKNLTFYQNLDFFQNIFTHTFCNMVFMPM